MELASFRNKLIEFFRKYRYAILVLLAGLLLMSLPGGNQKKAAAPEEFMPKASGPSLEEKLEQILSRLDGAGQVRVLLTVGEGEKSLYQQDTEVSRSQDSSSEKQRTVISDGGQRPDTGLLSQTLPEKYRGALILCQGADDPVVKLHLTQAVAKVTGLSTDRIYIAKMK